MTENEQKYSKYCSGGSMTFKGSSLEAWKDVLESKMTVRDLITELLKHDMNAKVEVATSDDSRRSMADAKHNVAFHITEIEEFSSNCVLICFEDWRGEE